MRRIAWGKVFFMLAVVCIVAAFALVRLGNPEFLSGLVAGERDADVYGYVGSKPVFIDDVERSYEQRSTIQQDLSIGEFFNETYAPRTMLLLEAEAIGVTVTEEEVDAWITVINSSLKSRNSTFESYLEDLDVTMDQLRRDIYESTLLDKVLEKLVAREVVVTAEEVREAYDAAGYEALGISLEEARNEIGPMILREKQDAHLRGIVEELRERYDVTFV